MVTVPWSYCHKHVESISLPLECGLAFEHVSAKIYAESNLVLVPGLLKALTQPHSQDLRLQYEPSLANLLEGTRPYESDHRHPYSSEAITNLAAPADTPVGYSHINKASQDHHSSQPTPEELPS